MADIEQFAVPLRILPNGRFATIEQDSVTDLAMRVNVLCHTPPRWLDGRPDFGLADQRFRKGGADLDYIAQQIGTWVPDADAVIDHDPRLLNEGLDYLGVQVAK